MNRLKIIVILLAILPFSNCVMANDNYRGDGSTDPVLVGSVSDALSRKPVQGVTISVVSKDNTETSFTTDAAGNFRIPRFVNGEVTLVLEKKGYKTIRREKI